MVTTTRLLAATRTERFDVICAGEPAWHAEGRGGLPLRTAGLLRIATILARSGMRVGVAAVLDDDRLGHATVAEARALGIDVGGVTLVRPATRLAVDAPSDRLGILSEPRGAERAPELPESWGAQVLLLCGIVPAMSTMAALCKAARRARREDALVVLDLSGGLRRWMGQDPKIVAMLLREVDVVRSTFMDLAMLGTDTASVRAAMRKDATFVVHDRARTTAAGAFGEVAVRRGSEPSACDVSSEECAAAICAELARPRTIRESEAGRWRRILRQPGIGRDRKA